MLCGWPAGAAARTQTQTQELPGVVAAAFKRAGIPPSAVGSFVQEVGSVAPVVAVNTTTPFNPASTMKLLTTDAALELLGPTFTWKTQAYANGLQDGEVLQGDLVIRGSGDPKLVIENFWLFLRQIRARGIRDIRGDLLLDRSAFAVATHNAAQFDGEPLKSYNAGPDALLLNYKSFGMRFVPDLAHGNVNVVLDPPLAGYKVVAPILTDGECDDWQGRLRANIQGDGASFDGVFPLSCGEQSWHVLPYTMTDTQYFDAVFRQMWRDLGGSLSGEVREGVTPPAASLITEWQSPTLPEVIRDINKYSNNVMARQLLLTLASGQPQLPATSERAAQVIRTWLADKHIDAPDLVIENGSGLSRTERIAAGTMGRMLVAAFRGPTMPEFMSSLPLVGYDGTMRRRLKDQGVAGYAHIKTGTLREVRALAGYVLAASGRRYVVVNLINHANAARGQEAQDLLLEWIYEHG
ncbi:D-alanyl-D-alanine carboxypeptidase/D-alanyl-D-alanine-endopeptidase [Undibacterium arcticum]|uniref:D-alanyl-D-alanine carboxypeptidase/D-alanyl-D-alanine-endopeptidase n=1 Tax=Undibacterium arcticum TaxID=1762892 RepID=A0ABV7EYE0_9BURK